MDPPPTQYAHSGDLCIAYQVVGDGPLDLVIVPGFISNVDMLWLDDDYARGMERLASFARVIVFDKRGTGLSDPVPTVATLEQRMDDVRAVMDAAGSERAALLGFSEGGCMSVLFAATYPERVTALVLVASLAAGRRDPVARPWWEPAWEHMLDAFDHWGEGRLWEIVAPDRPQTPLTRRMTGAMERAGASPAMARALADACELMDARDIAPHVQAPTLIVHREGDRLVPVELGRELAGLMPAARYVELPGSDHLWFLGDSDRLIDEVEQFLTGARQGPRPGRALATVVFGDIAGSTERAAALGDRRWRELLGRHVALVEHEADRARGRVVKWMGDGFLATFDGPGRAIACARAVIDGSRELGLELRAGVHTGECEIVGDDLGGMAVHIGARISALARPGEVLASSTVRDLVVGSGLAFSDRGRHALKGVPGDWRLFAVGGEEQAPAASGDDPPPSLANRALLSTARRSPRLAARMVRYGKRDPHGGRRRG